LSQLVIFRSIGRMPVVKADVKPVKIRFAPSGDAGHKLLRAQAGLLGGDHDRRSVGIIRADEMHFMPAHALKAHPDIGLYVFHDVADMEAAIGIRQGSGDKEATGRHGVKHGLWPGQIGRRKGGKADDFMRPVRLARAGLVGNGQSSVGLDRFERKARMNFFDPGQRLQHIARELAKALQIGGHHFQQEVVAP